jgi:hypothetical protein
MSLVSKAFSDIVTFSRSSNATRIGPTGRVEYAPHNLYTYSEDFSNADWSKTGTTVTSNTTAAPNGTVTADTIAIGTGTSALVQSKIGLIAGARYDVSFYFKKITATGEVIVRNTEDGSYGRWSINLSLLGSGWERITRTHPAVTITAEFVASPSGIVGAALYGGSSGISFYLWGAQLAVGPYPLDYTPTTSAAVYGPRFDYDPVTLAARGLLIEEQRTNLQIYSEDFSSGWSANNVTLSSNAIASPGGTATADKLIADSTLAGHWLYYGFGSTSGSHTWSVYAKAGEYSWLGLNAYVGGNNITSFDLTNGVIGTNAAGNTATIAPVGNGWYRCTVSRTGGAATYTELRIGNADNSFSFSGNGSGGIYIWGAQLEAGSFATSYIPTVAASVTRSADVASVNTLSPWFNSVESTLYAEGSYIGLTSGVTQTLAGLTAPVTSDYLLICKSSGTGQNFAEVLTSASPVASFNLGSPSVSTIYKIALAAKANDFAAVQNGGSVSTDTSGAMPSGIASLGIGYLVAGAPLQLNGHIRRIAYYPRRLTNAELQSLTS